MTVLWTGGSADRERLVLLAMACRVLGEICSFATPGRTLVYVCYFNTLTYSAAATHAVFWRLWS